MKIQKRSGSGLGSGCSPPPPSLEEGGEEEGEYVPNSQLEPALLRKIQTNKNLSKLDQEIVRLIGQHLCDLGLKTSSEVLMKEAGCRLDEPSSATFRHCIMKGDWTGAVNVLEDLTVHLESQEILKEMKFIILEQKFLEHIYAGKTFEALKVLQLEISPLHHSVSRTHQLSSYLMLPPADLTYSVRQSSTSNSSRRSGGGGGGGGEGATAPPSRRTSSAHRDPLPTLPLLPERSSVMERLQAFFPPSVMLPPRRLSTLLAQASSHQRDRCLYHNRVGDDELPRSYSTDHVCSKETFPCETIQILGDHCDEVWYCKWSPNGKLLATGSKDCTVIVWNFDPNTLKLSHYKVLEGHNHGVSYVAWSPDSARLAVCGPEDCPEVFIWDVHQGRLENKISHSQEDSLTSVCWSPDGRRLTAGGNRGQFYQCDSHGTVLDSWEGVRVQGLAYRADGKILAADTHHRLRCYSFEDLADTPTLQEDHAIMSFTLDQTDKYALLNIANQGVHLWNIQDKCLVQKFVGITQGFYTIYSSFGGVNQSFVASGSEDTHVYIFHVKREEPIAVLTGHSRTVSCVSWNPVYHQVLVSASDDNTVRLWGPAERYRHSTT